MKKLLLMLVIAATLLSCKKEFLAEQPDAVSVNTSGKTIYRTSGKDVVILDDTWFDGCTDEYIHVTGQITVSYNEIQYSGGNQPDGTRYKVMFRYDNTTGIGVTSGNPYKITGKYSDAANTFYIYYPNQEYYVPAKELTTGKFIWATPGKDNNLVTTIYYKLIRNSSGEIKISESTYTTVCL